MEEKTPFISVGHNPEGPDLPLGFGMLLAQEPAAISRYGALTNDQKSSVIRYIQSAVTGEEARNRIENAVYGLRDGDMRFMGGGS
jgi:uncharacterized protein YdeI (YjbR/CyaY-like superfamily)